MLRNQQKDIPVHEWRNININRNPCQIKDFTVSDVMTTDLVVVHQNDPVLILQHLMNWNNLNQILVENDKHQLTGIVALHDLKSVESSRKQSRSVKTIMQTDVKTINPDEELIKAKAMMDQYQVSALPVMSDGKLVGIVNTSHFKQFSINA